MHLAWLAVLLTNLIMDDCCRSPANEQFIYFPIVMPTAKSLDRLKIWHLNVALLGGHEAIISPS